MTAPSDERVAEIAAGLTEAQRDRLLGCEPEHVREAEYLPFWRCGKGLHVIAPGWQRLQLSSLGLAVRAHLQKAVK